MPQNPEHWVALFGLLFLVAGGLHVTASVMRGRTLCERFSRRHPEEYQACKSPWPGYFYSERRMAYAEFIMQKKFEQLTDRRLARDFQSLHVRETRELILILAGFGAVGVAYIWFEWLGGG